MSPQGLAFDAAGNLYVASGATNAILVFDQDGHRIGLLTPAGLLSPRGLAFGPDGMLYVSSFDSDAVLKIDPSTGDVLAMFTDPLLDGPEGLAFTADGFLFAAGFLSNSILRLDALDPMAVFTLLTAGGVLDGPLGLFAESWGSKHDAERGASSDFGLERLLVANHFGRSILEYGGQGDLLAERSLAEKPVGITSGLLPVPTPAPLGLLLVGGLSLLGYRRWVH